MKTVCPLLASIVMLFATCLVHAADLKPVSRVIAILDVETDDPAGYASWIKEYNEIAKAKVGVDNYLRVYQSVFDSRPVGHVRVVTSANSVAELSKNARALENDLGILQNRDHLRAIRKTGARVLYQAVYFDGPSPKGANNYNTLAMVTDEAGYVQAITRLRGIFDSIGLKDAKISVYRAIAGRLDHTHRITISTPSPERLAEFLDQTATNPQLNEWIASSAKMRTVVANSTSRELTK
ncbi:MAG: hypothetical protein Q7S40_25545 [Opitutaceae bacterium]|nr:hypothetical protein [Opitutaceae bacterium]